MHDNTGRGPTLCPSAQPGMDGAQLFGVLVDTPGTSPSVGYLTEALPVTPDLLAASGPVSPAEIMRIAAPCMGSGCVHFSGSSCQLAARVAAMLDPVVSGLPDCAIRPTCRWFRQEGRAACLRCPQMVTDSHDGSELYREVAGAVVLR